MEKISYGLMIWTEESHGSRYVKVQVMQREGDSDRPLGLSSNDQYRAYRENEPKHLVGLQLSGLGMYGFVTSDYVSKAADVRYIGYGVEYRDTYSIDIEDAARMLKTLKLVAKKAEADQAREPGDVFASLCAALKLSWVCERIEQKHGSRFPHWRWMSVGEGRNRYRSLIGEAETTARAAKFPETVAA